ncbi:M56 family metallopeptidase [Streptacidiphilus sp. EB129]|uniref:M56 family metallopeptidase n=1 Tax=Streptacidiphilus sp. EB129 TaxID=3156262 RepID=UPI003516FE4A
MIVTALLLGYAVLASRWLVGALEGAAWTGRAPRVAIAGWICLAGSLLCAVVFAGIAPLVPLVLFPPGPTPFPAGPDRLLLGLRHGGGPPGQAMLVLGLLVSIAVTLRIVLGCAVAWYRARRQRDQHEEIVRVVGRRLDGAGPAVVVVDHCDAAAYCLPGRGTRIVVTSAALRTLTDGQLHAVLAHERAHLRGRHHLLATFAQALEALLPRLGAFATVRTEILRLLELLADDAAARTADRLDLAEAVFALASAPRTTPLPARMPGAALAAAQSAAAQRVKRLLTPRPPLGPGPTASALLAIAATALAPVALLLGPALIAMCTAYCTSVSTLMDLLTNT